MAHSTFAQSPTPIPTRTALAEKLDCPFPLRVSPHAAAAHAHTLAWIRRFYGDARIAERADRARMAWMVAGFYPDASEEALCLAADYLSWAFSLDDEGDETNLGERPLQLAELFERFDAVFDSDATEVDEPESVSALRDIVARLRTLGDADDVKAFRQGNLAYFGGMLWEAGNRSGNWVPCESTFVTLRPAAGAVPPFFALIEVMQGFKLPKRLKRDPHLGELERIAGGVVCWVNDVLSYEKERAHGDVHNLAIVYETHLRLSGWDALEAACAFSNREVDGFVARRNSLPSFGSDDAIARKFVGTLESMMRITKEWTLGSLRYASKDGLEFLAELHR